MLMRAVAVADSLRASPATHVTVVRRFVRVGRGEKLSGLRQGGLSALCTDV